MTPSAGDFDLRIDSLEVLERAKALIEKSYHAPQVGQRRGRGRGAVTIKALSNSRLSGELGDSPG